MAVASEEIPASLQSVPESENPTQEGDESIVEGGVGEEEQAEVAEAGDADESVAPEAVGEENGLVNGEDAGEKLTNGHAAEEAAEGGADDKAEGDKAGIEKVVEEEKLDAEKEKEKPVDAKSECILAFPERTPTSLLKPVPTWNTN